MLQRICRRGLLAAGFMIACSVASASGLQVAPIGLTFSPSSPAQGLWLTNTGSESLTAQVRVFHWTQDESIDILSPTQALVASPPMISLAPGARQLIRVILTKAATKGIKEDAFRLLVDELPPAQQPGKTGVRYVMRHSIPVFVQSSPRVPESASVAAALHWSFVRDGGGLALQVKNAGSTHAQISAATLLPAGSQPIEVSPGLVGYVLPGMTMRWALDLSASRLGADTELKARINGKQLDQTFTVDNLHH